MKNHWITATTVLAIFCAAGSPAAELPNLAPAAKVSASSEYSGDYLASGAIDGKIPALGCKADLKQAWCVRGQQGLHGEFTLQWSQPVEAAEVVYFG